MSINANQPASQTTRNRAWAWGSLALLPVSFGLAFVAGEGIASLLSGSDAVAPPLWVMGVALTVAALIFALPLLLTARFSSRAAASGEVGARAPLIVGAILVGLFIIVNVVSGLLVLTIG